MSYISTFLFSILFFTSIISNAQFSLAKDADKDYYNLHYADAIAKYKVALLSDKDNVGMGKRLAHCYYKIADTKKAELAYKQFMPALEKDTAAVLELAKSLMENKKYQEAIEYYKVYAKLNGTRKKLSKIEQLNLFYKDTLNYQVKALNVNSNEADFSPAYYKNGIVFCSSRKVSTAVRNVSGWDDSPFLSLYISDTSRIGKTPYNNKTNEIPVVVKSSNYYAMGENSSQDTKRIAYYAADVAMAVDSNKNVKTFASDISTKFHMGPLCFTKGQDTIFFTSNNYIDGKYQTSSDGINKLKVFMAVKSGGGWKNAQELPFDNNQYSVGHPAFEYSSKKLYFCSDMPGGHGGADIYYSELKNGAWGTPINVGDSVNTNDDEMFPFADQHGRLYFASNGHPGLGGMDIFRIKTSGNDVPHNLGNPVNSSRDDFGLICLETSHGTTGYFSSNRTKSDDIYKYTFTMPLLAGEKTGTDTLLIKGDLISFSTGVSASPSARQSSNGAGVVASGSSLGAISTTNNKIATPSARASASAKGRTQAPELNSKIKSPSLNEPSDKDSQPDSVQIKSGMVFFDFAKAALKNEAYPVMNYYIQQLKGQSNVKMEIVGYTDPKGNAQYNLRLSERRARAVALYLITNGVSEKRFKVSYKGATNFIDLSNTDEGNKKNRRVELNIK